MEKESSKGLTPLSSEVGANVLASLVGFGIGGPLGAVVGAALTPTLTKVGQLAVREWCRNTETVLGVAAEVSKLPTTDLADYLDGEPRLIALMGRVLDAARITANTEKLRALGRLLGGEIGRKGATVDETALLVDVLNLIEEPHALVLRAASLHEAAEAEKELSARAETLPYRAQAVSASVLATRSGLSENAAMMAASGLGRAGALASQSVYGGGPAWILTGVGRAVLDAMSVVVENGA